MKFPRLDPIWLQGEQFVFNARLKGFSEGFTSTKSNGTSVINYTSTFGNTVHEIKHATQVQRGLIKGVPGTDDFDFTVKFTPTQPEIEAYRSQFESDPSSMPSSKSGMGDSLNSIGSDYIIGVYNEYEGVKSFPYIDYIGYNIPR